MSNNILLYAASENNSDIFYATGFWAPDPFVCIIADGSTTILLNQLEYGRGKREANVDDVVLLDQLIYQMKVKTAPNIFEIVLYYLKSRKISEVLVPQYFPVFFADYLRQKKICVKVSDGQILPQRIRKKPDEIKKITEAVRITEEAITEVIRILEDSKVVGDEIIYQREPLTSEFFREVMSLYFTKRNYFPSKPIVAGGEQACDPHQIGSGKLRPHRSIVLDVFPRSMSSFYWGDVSRTVVKGKPSKALLQLFEAVKDAQEYGCTLVKAHADGRDIHSKIIKFFEKRGFKTGKKNGIPVGFIHGTGHGLGLDIHEYPRIGSSGNALTENMVVTVEPGLYYPGIGGARIEDDVVVRKSRCENLVKLHKRFIID
ncbi:MAG: aminopeptidase P family protein [Planctomycetes bacterium]|nr:aminopeptidase P family protein [Planctomycetota bacterium]